MANKDFQNGLIVGLAAGSTVVEGGNLGYKVKFKVEGEDYYVASCQQGENIKEPPKPLLEGKIVNSWQDEDENDIIFPFIPTRDMTLTANIKEYNFLVVSNGLINIASGGNITANRYYWRETTLETKPSLVFLLRDYKKNSSSLNVTSIYAFIITENDTGYIDKTAGTGSYQIYTPIPFSYENKNLILNYSRTSNGYGLDDATNLNRFLDNTLYNISQVFNPTEDNVLEYSRKCLDWYYHGIPLYPDEQVLV